MPSHGALKEHAATEAREAKPAKKELRVMELQKAKNGGVTAEHHHTHYEHKSEMHVFGADEGHKLAAHLEKHLGIKMPGKAEHESTEAEE